MGEKWLLQVGGFERYLFPDCRWVWYACSCRICAAAYCITCTLGHRLLARTSHAQANALKSANLSTFSGSALMPLNIPHPLFVPDVIHLCARSTGLVRGIQRRYVRAGEASISSCFACLSIKIHTTLTQTGAEANSPRTAQMLIRDHFSTPSRRGWLFGLHGKAS
jgi:hypothetical protein